MYTAGDGFVNPLGWSIAHIACKYGDAQASDDRKPWEVSQAPMSQVFSSDSSVDPEGCPSIRGHHMPSFNWLVFFESDRKIADGFSRYLHINLLQKIDRLNCHGSAMKGHLATSTCQMGRWVDGS